MPNCATCNRTSKDAKFYGEFCEFCARDKLNKKIKDSIEITKCYRCGRIKVGTHYSEPTGPAIDAAIKAKLGGYDAHLINSVGDKANVEIIENTMYGDLILEKELELKWVKVLCERCYKKAGGYYEAVLQLRGSEERILKFLDSVTKYFEKNDEYVGKIEEVNNGYDVYLSSKKLAGEYLSFTKFHITKTFTLAGLKHGRRVYRNTYSIYLDPKETKYT